MVLGLDAHVLQDLVLTLLDRPDHSVRPYLLEFARRYNISV
jgi:hypothetical protein